MTLKKIFSFLTPFLAFIRTLLIFFCIVFGFGVYFFPAIVAQIAKPVVINTPDQLKAFVASKKSRKAILTGVFHQWSHKSHKSLCAGDVCIEEMPEAGKFSRKDFSAYNNKKVVLYGLIEYVEPDSPLGPIYNFMKNKSWLSDIYSIKEAF